MIRLIRRIFGVFLKRASSSFTVEIRRRQKRAAASTNLGWVETRLALSASGGKPLRVSTAVGTAKVEAPAAEPAAPHLSGRILADLAEIELQSNRLAEGLAERGVKDLRRKVAEGRKSKPTAVVGQVGPRRGRPKSSANEIASPMDSAPITARTSSAGLLDRATAIPPARPPAPSAGTAAGDSESATTARVKRPAKPRKSFESHRALPSLENLQPVIAVVAPSSRSSSASEGLPPVRQRKILGRYVFGDDLKPGERWKRRLPKGALR
jgi:hypothetical protein